MFGTGKLASGSMKKQLSFVLLELALIFISVFLAFSLSQWQSVRRDRQLAKTAIYNIEQEIRGNLAEVEESLAVLKDFVVDMHEIPDSLFTERNAFDLFIETLNGENPSIPILESSAWDAALASGAAQQIDYELLASLSSLYGIQKIGINKTVMSIADFLWDADMFDETRTLYQTRALNVLFQNLLGNENYYSAECREVITLLETAN